MDAGPRLVDLLAARLAGFLKERTAELEAISIELRPIAEQARIACQGGKRLRALFCYWGQEAILNEGLNRFDHSTPEQVELVVDVGVALEIFHAAALVHDDIIDDSAMRRNRPAAHVALATAHGREPGSARFGRAAALLLGDLLLAWSDQKMESSLARLADQNARLTAQTIWCTTRSEVAAGQYLDLVAENVSDPETADPERAEKVAIYKSAKYSVEAPLRLGAALAGANAEQHRALSRFGLKLGITFQMRDDVLGVFGSTAETGKPAGDDLRHGKHTPLVTATRRALHGGASRTFDELFGDPDLTEEQVGMLRETIRSCGALDSVEAQITRLVTEAREQLLDAPIGDRARHELSALAKSVAHRVA